MKIHTNKVASAKHIGHSVKDHRHTNSLFRTYEPALFFKRFLLLISLLVGLTKPVVAQTTTTNSVNLTNFADKSKAAQGQTITHTLVLTNTGTATVNGIVVRDSLSTGLRYLPNTSSTPPGTAFTVGVPISTWSVPSLSAGQSLSLTYQAVADSSGVLYSIATIPGDTAASCTSIPVRVCEGDTYLFQLTGPAGRSSYQWFKDGVEITSQTARVLNITAPGSYSLAVDNTTGKCPDFSLCPFIIEQYALPAFQASALSASCSGSTAQANGQIKLTGFGATDTYQYSEGTEFNPSASLPGTPAVIPADGLIATNLPNPTTNKSYTIRVYNASGCYVEKTVALVPASCCSLVATVTPGACDIVTNTFSSTVTVTLANSTAGVLTITDGPLSQTVATTGSGPVTAVFDNIVSNGSSHTLLASLAGCSSTSATYTAPASCSVAPPQPSLALTVSPGACVPATNQYSLSGTLSLSAAVAATLTLTDGTTSTTLAITAGQTTAPFTLDGLTSGSGSHTLTISGTGYTQVAATYTAPASCSVAPPQPSLALTVSPGACVPVTNQYTLSGTISLSAAVATTFTLTDGTTSTTLVITTGQTTAPFTLEGLTSGSGSHTLTVSGTGYTQVTATYTAPTSCSVAPAQPSLALTVSSGACVPATNQYTLSGTLSLSAAVAATLTLTDGTSSTTLAVTAGQTTAPFTLEGLLSGSGSHTLTVSGAGYTPVTATYTAPNSCSVAPAQPSLALTVSPGACVPATNQYSLSGTLSLSAAVATTLTLTDGTSSTTLAVTAGQTTAPFILEGLLSGSGSHTLIISGTGYTQVTTTYTAPNSCSVAPAQPSLAISITPGACVPATNQYTLSGTISLSAAVAATLTLTDGTSSTTLAVTAGQTTAPFILEGLLSGSGSHTLTVSGTGYTPVTATYTAPASCSVAPPQPSLALTVSPGACVPATNQYSLSGTFSLSAALATTLTLTDGTSSTTLSITAGQTTAPFTLDGLLSGSASRTLTVSGTGYTPVTATYTAPASCSVAPPQPSLAISITPGACVPVTNQYTLSGTISLSAAVAATLTLTDGTTSTTLAITTGQTTAPFTLDGLTSGSGSHTLTVSGTSYTQVAATYTAPASCSVAPVLSGLTLSVTDPGVCDPGSNLYTSTGIITLTNAPAGIATVTDGTITTSLSISAGATSVAYSLTGLISGSGMHTVTVNFVSQSASTTYIAPESCVINSPVPAVLALQQLVDKSKAKIGELISYTIVLTNTGASSASATTVQLTRTVGLAYVTNSATPPAGTIFNPGLSFSSWTIASISAGQSLSLTIQAKADSSGIFQNIASIPGDTAKVCTSIPAKVCVGEEYEFQISAAAGHNRYQWFRTFQGVTTELTSFTTNVLNVTQPGEYKLTVDGQAGQCPDFSCCPFIVEQDSLPAFQASARPATCAGSTAQANGQLVIRGGQSTDTYQYSLGSSFNEVASLSGTAKAIPTDGILASNLVNPAVAQAYTIRVYNESGCYRDVTVLLIPTVCSCPAEVCVPSVVSQSRRARRIGDPY